MVCISQPSQHPSTHLDFSDPRTHTHTVADTLGYEILMQALMHHDSPGTGMVCISQPSQHPSAHLDLSSPPWGPTSTQSASSLHPRRPHCPGRWLCDGGLHRAGRRVHLCSLSHRPSSCFRRAPPHLVKCTSHHAMPRLLAGLGEQRARA